MKIREWNIKHLRNAECVFQHFCYSLWEYSAHKKKKKITLVRASNGKGVWGGAFYTEAAALYRLCLIGPPVRIFQVRLSFDHWPWKLGECLKRGGGMFMHLCFASIHQQWWTDAALKSIHPKPLSATVISKEKADPKSSIEMQEPWCIRKRRDLWWRVKACQDHWCNSKPRGTKRLEVVCGLNSAQNPN